MRSRLIRFMIGALSALCFMSTTGAQAIPAHAAGMTLVVSAGTGSLAPCNVAGYGSINAALAAAPLSSATILVCPGSYTEDLLVNGYTNFKLIGIEMDGSYPQVLAPASISADGGTIITIANSTNATVQGLYIDGNENFAAYTTTQCSTAVMTDPSCYMGGIYYYNSSGSILKNYIAHIRRSPMGDDFNGRGIDVWSPGASKTVKILGNTVYDFQSTGIIVFDYTKATISQNYTLGLTTATSPVSNGIVTVNTSKTVISGNTTRADYAATGFVSIGINLFASSSAKITGNSIRDVQWGIELDSFCSTVLGSVNPQTNSNSISKNSIEDVRTGIGIYSQVFASTLCAPHADKNKITGNRITSVFGAGLRGLHINASYVAGPSLTAMATSNTFTGNTVMGFPNLYVPFSDTPAQIAGLKVSPNTFSVMASVGAPMAASGPGGASKDKPVPVPHPFE